MESPSTGETPAALPRLCRPVALRGTTLRNPIVISPMCQYSAVNGEAGDWHRVHLGRFAMGGAGMVMVEATAVTEQGRITPGDLGLWDDRQIPGLRGIAGTLKGLGAVPGIQLGHAGRKAATQRPWQGHGPLTATDAARGEPPWPVIAPSPLPVADGWPVPAELDRAGIAALVEAWRTAAARALEAGFEAVELHCAHGYLLHQFLSPLSNRRTDGYGGDPAGRCRFPLEVAAAVRAVWPVERPMFVRISATDWIEGGWTIEDSVAFSRDLRDLGIDVIDCSSGGMTGVSATAAAVPRHPGFQVPFAGRIRREAGIATMAVGLILDGRQAEAILRDGEADLVAIGREALDDPNWPLHARQQLCDGSFDGWPEQSGWWLARRARTLDHKQN
ncbi:MULTISPECIES: NADH:flavin oxidoreductase/NADH oxidase [Azospirillum]|uniref:NADH:flavin oxidoreductase/NADH oxidase n=1 Tax=Azospirillum brasilense TaxID=192 RepID=A0A4D8QV64_AZOBR|nr:MULTISPECIES: NADH:flavin oxidoreductase/NADH oxidase [Azospirillum]MDW7557644.1 NADH:flavin oxidoreductase/NADH oxidase [Azospirillum brasilense]MDW7597318.1 NADH:flavin oxidoreductase/NADH oxidase [Azospirillum brasilense]MDW7632491.1 NADH:flavin oxidoreductase/NADH oxidase [Azospirillum brasilense]MDX5950217.1 NADH:flavin oxidoreductase/NADH oxidase [Azospirillum brasilense]OPH13637.1 NADH:flavin oxidoreductase / NADH oxidase [Azospirillum brasilense]